MRGKAGFVAPTGRDGLAPDGAVLLSKEQVNQYEEAVAKLAELKSMLAL